MIRKIKEKEKKLIISSIIFKYYIYIKYNETKKKIFYLYIDNFNEYARSNIHYFSQYNFKKKSNKLR